MPFLISLHTQISYFIFLMQKGINKNVPSLYSYPGLSLVTLCWIQNLGTEDVQCLKRLFICIDLRNMRAHWAVILSLFYFYPPRHI